MIILAIKSFINKSQQTFKTNFSHLNTKQPTAYLQMTGIKKISVCSLVSQLVRLFQKERNYTQICTTRADGMQLCSLKAFTLARTMALTE